jgi:hypothetical protein
MAPAGEERLVGVGRTWSQSLVVDVDFPPGSSSDDRMAMNAPRPSRRLFCASLGAALLPFAGCARGWPPPVAPTPSAPEIMATHLRIMKSRGTYYIFDLELRNPAEAPRWLVFPHTMSVSAGLDMPMGQDPVFAIDTARLSVRPRVILVKLGGARMSAVLLPAHGKVMLRHLFILAWGWGVPLFVNLDLLVARRVEVGGVPIERRIGEDPMSEDGGDVDADLGHDHVRFRRAWKTPADKPDIPVDVDVESHVRATVEVRQPPPSP